MSERAQPERSGAIRVVDRDQLERELARDGGETIEAPLELALELGLLVEDVGSEEDVRLAGADPGDALGDDP